MERYVSRDEVPVINSFEQFASTPHLERMDYTGMPYGDLKSDDHLKEVIGQLEADRGVAPHRLESCRMPSDWEKRRAIRREIKQAWVAQVPGTVAVGAEIMRAWDGRLPLWRRLLRFAAARLMEWSQ